MPPESSQGCQGRYVFQPTVGTPPERYVFETPFTHGVQYAMELAGHTFRRYIWRYVKPSKAQMEEAMDSVG